MTSQSTERAFSTRAPSKFTPGPWYVTTHTIQVRANDERGDFPICDIRGWGHLTGRGVGALALSDEQAEAVQRANARLIAAAPELLSALQCALFDLEHTYGHVSSVSANRIKSETIPLCRAAIAKATGATS